MLNAPDIDLGTKAKLIVAPTIEGGNTIFDTSTEIVLMKASNKIIGTVASVHGFSIDAPSTRGSTGILDLGIRLTPQTELPVTIDLGIEAYTGIRQGFMAKLQIIFEF